MKTRPCPAWRPCLATLGLNLFILNALTGCSDWERDKPRHTETRIPTDAELPPVSPRQQAIRVLASRIRSYHHYDSLGVSHPYPADSPGNIVGTHGRIYHFATQTEERADLNRVLDSLRATGTLRMGPRPLDPRTDTLPYLGPHVTAHTTK